MREITKLENTSISDFRLHAEECEKQAFFLLIVCAAAVCMSEMVKEKFSEIFKIPLKQHKI